MCFNTFYRQSTYSCWHLIVAQGKITPIKIEIECQRRRVHATRLHQGSKRSLARALKFIQECRHKTYIARPLMNFWLCTESIWMAFSLFMKCKKMFVCSRFRLCVIHNAMAFIHFFMAENFAHLKSIWIFCRWNSTFHLSLSIRNQTDNGSVSFSFCEPPISAGKKPGERKMVRTSDNDQFR